MSSRARPGGRIDSIPLQRIPQTVRTKDVECARCTQCIASMRVLWWCWCCVKFIYIFDSSISPVCIKCDVFFSPLVLICVWVCARNYTKYTCRLVGKWMLRCDFMLLSSAAWPMAPTVAVSCDPFGMSTVHCLTHDITVGIAVCAI